MIILESFINGCIGGLIIVLPYIIYTQIKSRKRLNEWHKRVEFTEEDIKSINEKFKIYKQYIEIQVSHDDYCSLNFLPEVAEKLHIGDKLVFNRSHIGDNNFMRNLFDDSVQKIQYQEERFFPNSAKRCFVLITERLFHENMLELHGKVVPEDGPISAN